jgi:hypothetical protein
MGHVWTAPAVQGESDLSAKRSGAAMYPACFFAWRLETVETVDRENPGHAILERALLVGTRSFGNCHRHDPERFAFEKPCDPRIMPRRQTMPHCERLSGDRLAVLLQRHINYCGNGKEPFA